MTGTKMAKLDPFTHPALLPRTTGLPMVLYICPDRSRIVVARSYGSSLDFSDGFDVTIEPVPSVKGHPGRIEQDDVRMVLEFVARNSAALRGYKSFDRELLRSMRR